VWIPLLSFLIEWYRRSKFMKFLKEVLIRQSLSLCISRTKTPKHKNLPLICMIAEGSIFRKLRQPHIIEWRCGVESWSSKWVLQVSTFYITNKFCLFIRIQIVADGRCWRKWWLLFLGLYHINSMEILRVISMCAVLAFSILWITSENNLQRVTLAEHSWQGSFGKNVMSRNMGWLNLSIHIAESNSTFSQVTVVEPLNVANALNICIGCLQ